MACFTYSINIGTPTESKKYCSIQDVLNKLPDNSAQLISPKDVRDAVYTIWENGIIKLTTVASSVEEYIGIDNNIIKNKFFLGKKRYTTQEILNNTLLLSDTDIFIYNTKSDSDPNQNTKITFLSGIDTSIYTNAPYIESQKITSPNRMDLKIANPFVGGLIKLSSDSIELGTNGWIIGTSGALYPTIDGQVLGASPSGRIGTIYMSSTIDYIGTLKISGSEGTLYINKKGGLSASGLTATSIKVGTIYSDNIQITSGATAGYVLKSDGSGNALWQPDNFDTNGITTGQILIADGTGGVTYSSPTTVSADGLDGSIQFAQSTLISSDNPNFFWDNINKRLGIGTNSPSSEIEVIGDIISNNIFISGLTASNANISILSTSNATISGLSASNADIVNATISGLTTSNADIVNATISGLTTSNADIVNATISGLSASNADIVNATISGLSASNADITFNNFKLLPISASGSVLTSDATGIGTWSNPAHGTIGDIQFNDGSGLMLSNNNIKWDNSLNELQIKGVTNLNNTSNGNCASYIGNDKYSYNLSILSHTSYVDTLTVKFSTSTIVARTFKVLVSGKSLTDTYSSEYFVTYSNQIIVGTASVNVKDTTSGIADFKVSLTGVSPTFTLRCQVKGNGTEWIWKLQIDYQETEFISSI